jgi:hypothetical protein
MAYAPIRDLYNFSLTSASNRDSASPERPLSQVGSSEISILSTLTNLRARSILQLEIPLDGMAQRAQVAI